MRTGGKSLLLGLASEKGPSGGADNRDKATGDKYYGTDGKLDESIAELAAKLPGDVHVSTDIFRQSRFIESSIDNIRKALFEGAVFVVIVLFIFLMSTRTTVISLIALPLSLLTAVLALKALGLTINTMSLAVWP